MKDEYPTFTRFIELVPRGRPLGGLQGSALHLLPSPDCPAEHMKMSGAPRVYLAGPMIFAPDPSAIFARMKAICSACGVVGVTPLDNQIGLETLQPGKPLLQRIVQADITLMDTLEAGVFCLDGFRRGPEMDVGTAFEIGYMKALGKPIAGWTRDPRPYPDKVADFFRDVFRQSLVQTGAGRVGGTSGKLRDPDGILVHSDGCMQNAMVHVGIELAGGAVIADPDWEVAFRGAIASVLRQRERIAGGSKGPQA